MSGYQESVTDPSYRGQIIVFTYPMVGNYGVQAAHMESDDVHARAVIMREGVDRADAPGATGGWLSWLAERGIPALTGVDTRALVRHIRDKGAMRGGVFDAETAPSQAMEWLMAEPPMQGQDLAREVTPSEPILLDALDGSDDGPRVVAIDTGIKWSIVRNLRERGARVELHPCTITADEVLARDPDAVFLANGPGDPAALGYVVDTVRELVGKRPVWGICLGHQLLCRAVGLDTFKLPFGHRGANHPVKDLETGKVEITSQNHGFAVLGPGGEQTIDGSRGHALGDRLRHRRAQPAEPLRPHRRGPGAARRARLHGPVPPRGRARTARRQAPVRPLPGEGGGVTASGAAPQIAVAVGRDGVSLGVALEDELAAGGRVQPLHDRPLNPARPVIAHAKLVLVDHAVLGHEPATRGHEGRETRERRAGSRVGMRPVVDDQAAGAGGDQPRRPRPASDGSVTSPSSSRISRS